MTRLGALLVMTLVAAPVADPPEERLYARVTTAAGDVVEGFLRWDRNEASWADLLDGEKEILWEHLQQAEDLDPALSERRRRARSIEAFGVRITWDRDRDERPTRVSSAVRFGHLVSLLVLDDRRALLELRSGTRLELRSNSTDLGRSMRGLTVHDASRGDVELRWRDLDRIDFMEAPRAAPQPAGDRLHGTLTTRGGLELTGFVSWDMDEAYTTDVLDGRGEGDLADREIEFGRIVAIERESASGARVVLDDGEEVLLRGTNDVDRSNRGVEIADPDVGRAIVSWDDLDALTLHPRRRGPAGHAAFGPSRRLRGEVVTVLGERVSGQIRWDNDEEWGWEMLDGRHEGVELDIEFSRIASIARDGRLGAEVTLLDGRTFSLRGTNDVDHGNKGVFVTLDSGRTVLVSWLDLDRVAFEW